jgi:protein TIF31
VHNNIFFSFAVDGDFSLMQQMREQKVQTDDVPKETANASNGDVTPDVTESQKSDTSANEDPNAAPTSVVESEQATYASANNDLKGTKAYNNADVAGLYTLAMAIIDFRGHRVVAQVGAVINYQGSSLVPEFSWQSHRLFCIF